MDTSFLLRPRFHQKLCFCFKVHWTPQAPSMRRQQYFPKIHWGLFVLCTALTASSLLHSGTKARLVRGPEMVVHLRLVTIRLSLTAVLVRWDLMGCFIPKQAKSLIQRIDRSQIGFSAASLSPSTECWKTWSGGSMGSCWLICTSCFRCYRLVLSLLVL